MDIVYRQWISSDRVEKGAYINDGHTWVWSPQFIPPIHTDNQGAKFVDLNADGKVDLVYHTRISSKVCYSLRFRSLFIAWGGGGAPTSKRLGK